MITLRNNHPVFHRRNFSQGRANEGADIKDILWLWPDGQEMTDEEWKQESARCLGSAATHSLEARSIVMLVARAAGQIRHMERRHDS
jgi:pullulanase/glycogen debranching enzyme